MKQQNIIAINNMRLKGWSTATISKVLGIPYNTVKSHIRRYPDIPGARLCLHCRKPVEQPRSGREKKHCSDQCRMAYWNSHQDQVQKKAYYNLVCHFCGKEFRSYGNRDRKFCCRDCYLASRKR